MRLLQTEFVMFLIINKSILGNERPILFRSKYRDSVSPEPSTHVQSIPRIISLVSAVIFRALQKKKKKKKKEVKALNREKN